MKSKIRVKNKSIVIDTGLIKKELESKFTLPSTKSKVTEVEKISEKVANDVIGELIKRSSMRESQGSSSPYFQRGDINRGVFNQPFQNASVTVTQTQSNDLKISLYAPIISTKSSGTPVDIFDILENGRPRRELGGDKKIVFPATRTGAERLIKKRLTGVRDVKRIFRAQKARYKKEDGRIVLVFMRHLPEITPRGILGVIARDIEDRLAKKEITLKTLGIKGQFGKGKGKIKVRVT